MITTTDPRERLSALVRQPETTEGVTLAEIPGLLAQLAGVQAVLLARLVVEGPHNGSAAPADGDRNLSVAEAAGRLGVKPGYLYRHAGSLPFTVRIGRRLVFSAEGLERWNRRRQGRG
jgi:hypothetical protein